MSNNGNTDIVPLDPETAHWLWRLERLTGTPAVELVASMLNAIRIDDELAHNQEQAAILRQSFVGSSH